MVPPILDERFVLYEGGNAIPAAKLQSSADRPHKIRDGNTVIDIEHGVASLITALVNRENGGNLYIVRDRASLPDLTAASSDKIWLQTSGTTGKPKWIAHSLEALRSKIAAGKGNRARWLLSYSAGSFAGLQVVLSAMAGGHDLMASSLGATITDLARLAVQQKVTHISGTPTFWRSFLMVLDDAPLDLKSVTVGGEMADQPILDALRQKFPDAALRHIYATTEAGVIFSVSDGRAGFPSLWLEEGGNGIKLSVSDEGTLIVCNPKASDFARDLKWDTKDVVDVVDDRVFFKGRLDSMVNVGGIKVYPEEVEAFILKLPFIQEVRVGSKPNPITGNILVAEVVVKPSTGDLQEAIRSHMNALPRAHRPVSFRFVDHLDAGSAGKKIRLPEPLGEG